MKKFFSCTIVQALTIVIFAFGSTFTFLYMEWNSQMRDYAMTSLQKARNGEHSKILDVEHILGRGDVFVSYPDIGTTPDEIKEIKCRIPGTKGCRVNFFDNAKLLD